MLVSYEWLKELVDLKNITADELAEKMSRTGIEVDGVNTLNDGLKKVVVGYTLDVTNHPDADHLHVCQVDVGEDEPLQIVCGAPNIQAHQKVIVALHNSWVAGHTKIKKGRMRGVMSQGMICSLEEIGINPNLVPKEYADGIMVLPEDAPIGESIVDYLQLDDPILDLDVTPNRADAFSMVGNAYEVGAIYNRSVTLPAINTDSFTTTDHEIPGLTVQVSDSEQVKEYNAILVEDVTVKPSPLWLQMRLIKAGIRPINNVVDITNYLLMAYGQPLHAFDYDQLGTNEIVTRQARPGETLTTLDEEERLLTEDDIVITDGQKPVALAGVMGGLETEISEATKNVLIESAIFDGASVRKTARRLGLRSESSIRNERGVNPETTLQTGIYAAQMMQELAGGTPEPTVIHQTTIMKEPTVVTSNVNAINSLLGLDLSYDEMCQIFEQLGFGVSGDSEQFDVSVPMRRLDVQIGADLAEEVARIYGYDKIPSTLPELKPSTIGLTPVQQLKRLTHRLFLGMGYDEVMTYSLTSEAKVNVLAREALKAVPLSHPQSDDRRYMRTNLLTSLLDVAEYNVARKLTDIQIYELGRVYDKTSDGEIREREHVAGLWSGVISRNMWVGDSEPVNFYHIKGTIEHYFQALNLTVTPTYVPNTTMTDMHPGQTADIQLMINGEETVVGFVGRIHPSLADKYALPENTYVFELDFQLISTLQEQQIVQTPLPKYPGMSRDIALIVPEAVTYAQIKAVIESTASSYLKHVTLFDIYRGEHIETGKKSMAFGLFYQNPEATLVDEDVSGDVARISEELIKQFDAGIR
ncbi:MAG: phenylalanine--tRNA ligase subunit beta [Aerococcus sp.]|nr:phenylalanine--tRNA ligase subunit beta [Aerococcus sp.]